MTEPVIPQLPHIKGKTIIGTNKSNYLIGTVHDDTINGNGGNDTINGDGGYDTINGGVGQRRHQRLAAPDEPGQRRLRLRHDLRREQ